MSLFKLKGLDDFTKEEIDDFWRDYDSKKDRPKILGVSLSCSDLCNLKCIYCYAGTVKKPSVDELTLEEQISIIKQAKDLGARTVVLCGDGEPSMDKNLVEMTKFTKANDMIMVVVTNGVIFGDDMACKRIHNLTGEELLKTLYDNDASLVIKLESLIEDKYEHIVGVKGSYNKYRVSINRMVSVGFGNCIEQDSNSHITKFAFSSVIMKNNIEELHSLKEFADNLNAQFICKLPTLVGNALDNIENMFEVSHYEDIRKKLFDYTAKRETLMVDTPRCMAWHYGPCIGINGEIRECYTSPYIKNKRIGNIREASLEELIRLKNQNSNLTCNDFCPVKTRINKELEEKGIDKVWKLNDENKEIKISGF